MVTRARGPARRWPHSSCWNFSVEGGLGPAHHPQDPPSLPAARTPFSQEPSGIEGSAVPTPTCSPAALWSRPTMSGHCAHGLWRGWGPVWRGRRCLEPGHGHPRCVAPALPVGRGPHAHHLAARRRCRRRFAGVCPEQPAVHPGRQELFAHPGRPLLARPPAWLLWGCGLGAWGSKATDAPRDSWGRVFIVQQPQGLCDLEAGLGGEHRTRVEATGSHPATGGARLYPEQL